MIHGDPLKLEPYRVEWRSDLTTSWVVMASCESHDEARELLLVNLRAYGGQVRIVVQHVTEAKGLGA
jgi:hypothetical protein